VSPIAGGRYAVQQVPPPPFVGPGKLTGIEAWYDPMVAASITVSGSNITGAKDLSPHGNDIVEANAANQPTVATINGHNAFGFGGFVRRLVRATVPTTPTPCTVAYVCLDPGVSPYCRPFHNGNVLAYMNPVGTAWNVAASATLDSGVANNGTPKTHIVVFDGVNSRLYENGVGGTIGDSGSGAFAGICLGNDPSATSGYGGSIGSYVVVDHALNAQERFDLLTEWHTQWGTPSPPAMPFTPFDAAAWGTVLGDFDASNPASITEVGGRVSAIAATTGTLPTPGQGNAAGQPWTGTRQINGRNAFEFKGGQNLEVYLSGIGANIPQPFTMAVVFAADETAGGNYPQVFGDSCSFYHSNGFWRMYGGSEVGGPTVDLAPHCFVGIYDADVSEFWEDGTLRPVGRVGFGYQTYVTLGAGMSVAYPFTGIEGQVIYFAGRVADPGGLANALAARWGTP
jgi:hypothetical protein